MKQRQINSISESSEDRSPGEKLRAQHPRALLLDSERLSGQAARDRTVAGHVHIHPRKLMSAWPKKPIPPSRFQNPKMPRCVIASGRR